METKRLKNRINEAAAVFVPLFVILIASILCGFNLSSNDDALIRSIVSGSFTGTPEAHGVYIMYPLGLLFKGLYSVLPNVAWYDLFMVFVHFMSFYFIMSRVVRRFERVCVKWIVSWMTAFILGAVDFVNIVNHQYTLLAGVIAASAVITFMEAGAVKDYIASAVLMIVTLWLRKEVLFLSLPVFVIILIYKRSFKGIKTLFFVALVIGLSLVIEALAYGSPEWKEFKDYNKARTECFDYNKLPEYEQYKEFYDGLGISESEYRLCVNCLDIGITEGFTKESFEALSTRYDEIMKEWQQFYSVPRKLVKDTALAILNDLKSTLSVVLLLIVASASVLCLRTKKFHNLFVILMAYCYRPAVTAFFIYKSRYIDRVSIPLVMMITAFAASALVSEVCGGQKEDTKSLSWGFVLVITLPVVVMACMHARDVKSSVYTVRQNCNDGAFLYDYCQNDDGNIYFVNAYSVATIPEAMFTKTKPPKNLLNPGTWLSHSPLEAKRLRENGILSYKTTLANEETLATSDKIFYIVNADFSISFLTDYISNEMGEDFEAVKTDTITLPSGTEMNVFSLAR